MCVELCRLASPSGLFPFHSALIWNKSLDARSLRNYNRNGPSSLRYITPRVFVPTLQRQRNYYSLKILFSSLFFFFFTSFIHLYQNTKERRHSLNPPHQGNVFQMSNAAAASNHPSKWVESREISSERGKKTGSVLALMFEQAMSDSRGSTHAYIYSAFLSLSPVRLGRWLDRSPLTQRGTCMYAVERS